MNETVFETDRIVAVAHGETPVTIKAKSGDLHLSLDQARAMIVELQTAVSAVMVKQAPAEPAEPPADNAPAPAEEDADTEDDDDDDLDK